MEFKFKCANCGGTQLEEVSNNGIIYTEITSIRVEDGVANCDYGIFNIESSDTCRYQCSDCGQILMMNGLDVNNFEDLATWFETYGIDETDVVDVESITEAQKTREITENARKVSGNRSIDRLAEAISKAAFNGESYIYSERLERREIKSIAIAFRQKGFIVEDSSPCFLKISW